MPHFSRSGYECSFAGLEKLCFHGNIRNALHIVDNCYQEGVSIPTKLLYLVLKGCILKEDLAAGKQLLGLILKYKVDVDTFLGSHLIRMFMVCRSLPNAVFVFNKLSKPSPFAWSAIISAHSNLGQKHQAIKLYYQMMHSGIRPDGHVLVAVLKACSSSCSIQDGKLIHADFIENDILSATYVGNALVDMYCKCGSVVDGQSTFNKCQHQDAITWNTLISGYAHDGHSDVALQLLQYMQQKGLQPNCTTWNAVIFGFAQEGKVHDVLELFRQMQQAGVDPNVATWNAMIGGYAQYGLSAEALRLFQLMEESGLEPNQVTLLCILRASAKPNPFQEGLEDQARQLVGAGSVDASPTSPNENSLVDIARNLFDKLPKRTVEAWNAMIGAYAQQGLKEDALSLFQQMQQCGAKPDSVTFVSVLKACSCVPDLDQGMLIHSAIIESMCELDAIVASSLIGMYAKCGGLESSCYMFDQSAKRDIVTWTVIIAGCVEHESFGNALQLFHWMQQEGMVANRVTFLFLLKGCSTSLALNEGKLIHASIIEHGCELDMYVGSTLINMYCKCESFEDAKLVFEKLPTRLAVAWNVMIVGYAKTEHVEEALQLFYLMQQGGLETNQATYVAVLKGCSITVALDQGKLLHVILVESGLELNEQVGSALVDMYAKCGSIKDASKVFLKLPKRDIVTWNTLISGYAKAGDHQMALRCFEGLQSDELEPDGVTFVCLLALCSELGLLDRGCFLFKSMKQDHGIVPASEHYNCMVDLLGRAGFLNGAEDFLYSMPLSPSLTGQTSLLSQCGKHLDILRAGRCFDQIYGKC